jgi:hypothetical protein
MEKTVRYFDINCVKHDNGNTYWEDGCHRIYHNNGVEKESKVICYIPSMGNAKEKYWSHVIRDESENIVKEFITNINDKPVTTNRIIEAMDFDSNDNNWKYPFDRMTKFYGKDFINCIKNMWSVNEDVQSEDEFCIMNAIPKTFFEKTIKNA